MLHRSAAVAVAVLALAATPASAHQVNPNYLTRVDAITPATKGVTVDVINRDDRLLLRNRSGHEVVVGGYNDEPYARIEPDGTVSVNTQSPAYYLNDDRYGDARIPDGIDGKGAPRWKVLDKTGRFEWHDHRMHWMARTRPPQVKDPAKRTTIFRWKVPLSVDGRTGDIAGTLFWTPRPATPIAFIIIASIVMVALCAAALVVRRRRDRTAPAAEAW